MTHSIQSGEIDLNREYSLSDQSIEAYRRDGHVKLDNVALPEEIVFYRPHILQAVQAICKHGDGLEEIDFDAEGRKESLLAKNTWKQSEIVQSFIFGKRFARIAAQLMGVERVRLLVDYAVFKEPGDRLTGWHQDSNYIPVDTDHVITMWMPLVPLTEEAGSMVFFSGSHHYNQRSGGDHYHLRKATKSRLPQVSYPTMSAGDATFHAGWTLHSANANTSAYTREVITILYVADPAYVLEKSERFFLGVKPGERLLEPNHPLLYEQGREG